MPFRRLPVTPPVEAASLSAPMLERTVQRRSNRQRALSSGLAVSLLLHSLPLLALIGWRATPPEVPKAVPVEFVVEPPKPAPKKPPPKPAPPQIRGASADFGAAAAKPQPGLGRDEPGPTKPEPPAEAETSTKPLQPTPEPPVPNLVEPPHSTPLPPDEQAESSVPETKAAEALPPLPAKPAPKKPQPQPSAIALSSAWPLPLRTDRPQPRLATLVGPPAVRDEYCERALHLTLAHLDVLPLSFLNGRRGKTLLTIRILGDGTLNSVKVTHSSGYPDIDARIEQMVFAVGRYPPLPPRLPGTWMDFTFLMVFPDAMQR